MKIAMVCPYALDRPGGVQQQAIQLVEWLRAAGHQAWLVAPGRSGGPEGTVLLGPSVPVPANQSVAPIRFTAGVGRRVLEAMRGADLVHIHEPLAPMVGLAATMSAPIPSVGTFHAALGSWGRRVSRSAYATWGKQLTTVTAVSDFAAASIRSARPDLLIIPNAIDVSSFRPSANPNPGQVAFLGRDEPRKGLDVLLAAWPEVQLAQPDAKLIVAGTRRPQLPGVEFLGAVAEEHKREILASSEVLVAPNTGRESFGVVLIEGMASGCVVVASALPAFREVLGRAGRMVPVGNSKVLAKEIILLLSDGGLLAELRARGLARAQAFDRPEVLPRYLQAYEMTAAR